MKINGTDIRVYNAKQLTADVQPPSIVNNYEWLSGATLPTELETDVQMGHLKLSIYFKGKDRNSIIRSASEFMMNFTKPCRLELDGYKGTYIGFITSNDYEKKNVKQRYVVNLEFDGFFVDDDLSITFDGKTSASFYKVGTRDTPCVVEVYAKSTLTNYTINGLGEDIVVESLAAGKTVVIDAKTGLVTIDGANAFDKVDLWEFPVLKAGETALTFSNTKAIETYLNDNLDLEIKGDWQVFRFEYPVMKDGKPVLDENRKQVTKGRMLDFMGFQFHHDRTTIRKSNIESARRKANHISKQDKISWYNASVMLSYMGLFKHTDTYNYYIEYIKPKINVKKLKRIVSKHSRKENEQHDRLEKGDRNTAGTSGGNRQDIVSVNGLSA